MPLHILFRFELSFPKNNKQGLSYEPWHWRYVGVETAKELKKSGQVLEEYLGAN